MEFYSCVFFCLFPLSTLSFKREKGFLIYPIVLCLFGNGLCLFLLFFFLSFFSPFLLFHFPYPTFAMLRHA